MLRRKTVLVLGAGSSVEFRLPAGAGLITSISTMLNFRTDFGRIVEGDDDLFNSVWTDRNDQPLAERLLLAGQQISRGLPLARSIDDFLYIHGSSPEVVTLGKAAIAKTIIGAERGSRLGEDLRRRGADRHVEFHKLHDTWLYRLFSFLWTGVRPSELKRLFANLSVINFNYDRCVEQFLFEAVQVAYNLDADAAAEVAGHLDIVHPYGQVGLLPWQGRFGDRVRFGAEGADWLSVAGSIKTFTEQAHDPAEVASWRQRLQHAQQVVFLGFAFHKQNMDLLKPEDDGRGPWPTVYATTLGTSSADQIVFRQRIDAIRRSPPHGYSDPELVAVTCADFVSQYGLRIAS